MIHKYNKKSNSGFDVPDKGTETQIGCGLILCLEVCKDRGHFLIRHHRHDGHIHGRPCVTAEMRLAVHTTPALDIIPAGKTSLSIVFKHLDDLLAIGLVV